MQASLQGRTLLICRDHLHQLNQQQQQHTCPRRHTRHRGRPACAAPSPDDIEELQPPQKGAHRKKPGMALCTCSTQA